MAIIAFLSVVGIGVVDYITGSQITFALFYLFPVAIAAWFSNKNTAIAISLFSAVTWLAVDYFLNRIHPNLLIYSWNYLSRFILLIIIVLLLRTLKILLLEKHDLSREDPITKSLNLRAFREIAEVEVSRAIRYGYALSLAYIDVDNFKAINDTRGHDAGNKLLCAVVDAIRENLRDSDIVARVGGDEFVLLLPVTDQISAQIVIAKIQNHLMSIMDKNDWPVTFSFGVLTCIENIPAIDRIIAMADHLMYSVKKGSKNGAKFMTYWNQNETDS
ncbi:MAG: GGDEF domain-containing protein [Candidatus Competibacteraceae bacterium]|nr:GGDEF domain-containing protein [Candidatus Competibacteraceae bacterium]